MCASRRRRDAKPPTVGPEKRSEHLHSYGLKKTIEFHFMSVNICMYGFIVVHVYNLCIFIYLKARVYAQKYTYFLGHTFLSLEVPALYLHLTN